MAIKLGPAGTDGDSVRGLRHVAELGLDACEIEFVHGVNMSLAKAREIGELAKELRIDLSIHAPYYINLISEDPDKIEASKKRILDSCERGHAMGARYIVFHAGFYGKMDKKQAYDLIKKEILEMQATIKRNGWSTILAPETTGKHTQFGDIDELLHLADDTGCSLTVDFAHIYARQNGKIDYDMIFSKLKKHGIKHIHSHFSGIEFSEKGEKRHLVMEDGLIRPLISAALRHGADITIISESPITWQDSLKMKEISESDRQSLMP